MRALRFSVFLAFAMAATASGASAAPVWTVEPGEIAALFYGEPAQAVLSISCAQGDGETERDETRIEVEVERGTKRGDGLAVLRVEEDGGRKEVPLTAQICGGETHCSNRADGEIYRYEASVPGKTLALDIARKGRKLTIDAPGAKISAPADAAAFKKFAVHCLNW